MVSCDIVPPLAYLPILYSPIAAYVPISAYLPIAAYLPIVPMHMLPMYCNCSDETMKQKDDNIHIYHNDMATTAEESRGILTRSFVVALIVFVVLLPFCRSRKSWWDAIAARKVTFVLKVFIVCELFAILPLIYCVVMYGSPITLKSHETDYYWTFGYGRPVFGIVMLSLGLFAEMHAVMRWMCKAGCVAQATFDFLSAFLVYDYIHQVNHYNASTGSYSLQLLNYYFWRDVGSFGLSVLILLLALHLSNIVGLCQPQLISFQAIVGGDFDRLAVLNREREKRRIKDYRREMKIKSFMSDLSDHKADDDSHKMQDNASEKV